ncbi:MAG: ribose uptake protein RbsU [Acetilactobacillus jinshanensis]
MMVIFGTGIGYGACSILPKIPETSGWATFPPQSIGMIISAILFAALKRLVILKLFWSLHREKYRDRL